MLTDRGQVVESGRERTAAKFVVPNGAQMEEGKGERPRGSRRQEGKVSQHAECRPKGVRRGGLGTLLPRQSLPVLDQDAATPGPLASDCRRVFPGGFDSLK